MRRVSISCEEKNMIIGKNIAVAESFWSRLVGLMFKKDLVEMDGLYITFSKSIHTCFMRFHLDVIFLSRELKVVKIIKNMKPWRMTLIYFSARDVIELRSGSMPQDLQIGDQLRIKNV